MEITSAYIRTSDESADVESFNWIDNSIFTGKAGSSVDLDVSIVLHSGQSVQSLRTFSPVNFSSLVQFSSSNNEVITIDNDKGQAVLLQNSQCITLTASITNLPEKNMNVIVDLLPDDGGLDLMVDSLRVNTETTFSVSVFLNTGDNTVNGIESVLMYNSSLLEALNVTVADSQWTGGTFLYSLADSGIIKFGGISLNEGLQGARVHVANVYFKAMSNSGTAELYAFVNQLLEENANQWNTLSLASSDSNFSRIFVSVSSDNSQTCNLFPSSAFNAVSVNCGESNILIGNESYPCPIGLSTTGSLISDILSNTPLTKDPNQDGLSNSLDPLYTTQVTFDILATLESVPTFTNSSRDPQSNACDITIFAELDSADGTDAQNPIVNVSFLFDTKNKAFFSLFNTTTSYIEYNVYQVRLESEYDSKNERYITVLQTSREEIQSGLVSVSLVQTSNGVTPGSPAGIFPMVSKDQGLDLNLSNVTLEDFALSISRYSPLVAIDQSIVCPPLLFPDITNITAGSRLITLILSFGISEADFTLYIYNCSLANDSCDTLQIPNDSYYVYTNWSTSGTTVTIEGLLPYSNYSIEFRGDDRSRDSGVFTVTTLEAAPEGFDESNIAIVSRGPTYIVVEWTHPTFRNGKFRQVNISYEEISTKREVMGTFYTSITNITNQEVNITSVLNIATKYNVFVTYENRVGSVGPVIIETNTSFPSPQVGVTNSSECINISIDQPYYVSPLYYNITFECLVDSSYVVNVKNGSLDNPHVERICYNDIQQKVADDNGTFCYGSSYVVIVELERNGFTNYESETVGFPIVRPTTSTLVSTTTTISSTISMSMSGNLITSVTEIMSTLTTPGGIPSTSTTGLSQSIVTTPTGSETVTSVTENMSSIPTSILSTSTTGLNRTTPTGSRTSSIKTFASMTTTSISTTIDTGMSKEDNSAPLIAGAVVGIVIFALLLILLVMVLVWYVRRGKKTGSMDIYSNRPTSRTSKDIFFHMEETVEMSPIDIVPVGQNHCYVDHYIDETVMNDMGIIENKNAFTSTIDSEIPTKDNGGLRPPPPGSKGRAVTFNEKYASYDQPSSHTYYNEDDDDELIDLKFNEDMQPSQAYLSLGLTPISQLSPDPMMSSSTGTSELGFFPSMLPPISPLNSMMNTNGISVDNDGLPDDHPDLDNLVMPDGLVSYNLANIDKVRNRSGKPDQLMGAARLETLIEQSSLEADDFSSSFGGMGKLTDSKLSSTLNTSISTSDDELIFPSADGDISLSSRKKPVLNDFDGGEFSRMFPSAFGSDNTPSTVGLPKFHQPSANGNIGGRGPISKHTNQDFLMDYPISSKDQDKQRRLMAKEMAKAEQKALLVEKEKQENEKKLKERQDRINKDYSTFPDKHMTSNSKPSQPRVIDKIGKFEAVAELNEEKKSQELLITSPSRGRYNPGLMGLVSPHHSYSGRPRKPSNDSLDPKPVEDQVTIL